MWCVIRIKGKKKTKLHSISIVYSILPMKSHILLEHQEMFFEAHQASAKIKRFYRKIWLIPSKMQFFELQTHLFSTFIL